METDDPNNFTQSEQNAQTSDASLACNCCRKRKLRCSRETPICEHCRRTGQECVYETKRAKPGMRAGAIENVHRRLDALEQTIAKQQITIETLCAKDTSNNERSPRQEAVDGQSLLLSLAKEICKLGDVPESIRNVSHKRRRTDDDDRSQPWAYTIHQPPLPDDITLDQVLNAYFRQVHPWMPMIHEARLRRRLQEGGDKTNLIPLLQAIMLIAHRYVARKDVAESIHDMLGDPEDMRDWVVAKATKSLSLESLQSLIVICYLDIGDGEESRAWSPIGALTRMVEYLQITTECEEASRLSFSQPYISLHPPQGWTESEERRRVFWCVFNLDRFCSVTTGWNTSLTSDDVNRRLPCDGISWRKEDPVSTPYFGIWDRSAGRIGNPIAFPLSHSVAPPTVVDEDGVTPLDAMTSPEAVVSAVDMSTVGAFAYCIEATESMSRVMTYFLQQKVNIKDQKNLSSWLTRFKELDVRLVHWKMLLPRKWKVDISHQSSASKMDPNLTLAHVTHNASMILLHQPIAFPPSNWTFKTRLPSFCSLETCHAAAVEIATITDHYLRIATLTGPLSNQFAFCVYLAARVLLLHWRYCVTDMLSPEFWVLLESLGSMAKRWKGPHQLGPGENLASKYWSVLTELHTQCMQNGSFSINPSAYTTEVKHVKGSLNATQKAQSQHVSNGEQQTQTQVFPNGFPQRSSTPWRQMTDICLLQNVETQQDPPGATGNAFSSSAPSNAVAGQDPHRSRSVGSEDLGVISQMLLDAEFVDMDRVISFDDGIFGMDNEGGCF